MPKNARSVAKAETSNALIASARQHFFDRGYADASMEAICQDAGVTRGALYHNFGGKLGLFEAVVRQINDEIFDRLEATTPEDWPTLDGFVGGCLVYLQLASEPEAQKIVFREAPAVLGQKLRDLDAESYLAPLQEALEELMRAGEIVELDAVALARMLNSAVLEGALLIAESDRDDAAIDRVSRTVEGLIFGLKSG